MGSVRVAIVGVGNCASSLVQGVEYYKDADEAAGVPGLMHVRFGDYHVERRRSSSRRSTSTPRRSAATSPTRSARARTTPSRSRTCRRPESRCSAARRSTVWASTTAKIIESRTSEPVDVVAALRERQRRRLVCYLPVGSEEAAKLLRPVRHRRRRRLRERPAGVHRRQPRSGPRSSPRRACRSSVTTSSRRSARRSRTACWRSSSRTAASMLRAHVPAQRRRQHGLQEHAGARAGCSPRRSPRPSRSPPRSRTRWTARTCTSAPPIMFRGWTTGSWAFVRLEGRAFGDVPLSLEYKLEVWDSPTRPV